MSSLGIAGTKKRKTQKESQNAWIRARAVPHPLSPESLLPCPCILADDKCVGTSGRSTSFVRPIHITAGASRELPPPTYSVDRANLFVSVDSQRIDEPLCVLCARSRPGHLQSWRADGSIICRTMPSASARGRMLSAGANPHMLHKERDSTIEVHSLQPEAHHLY